jgi:hypothetical protein
LAYLPYDSDEPPPLKGLREVVYCSRNKLQFIIGCDANAHHIIWGSTDINPRGECLMEYLVSTNLSILNKGNEPTFVISNRKEVIELTLGTDKIGDLVTNWHVSDEISMSDHRYIVFQVGDLEVTRITYRNPKRTNWESYQEDLKVNLGFVPRVIHSVRDVELAVDMLQQATLSSYHQNCPARVALSSRTVPWWNKELSHLKASTDGFLIKLKGQVTGNHIRRPSPVITKRLQKPHSPLGGTTVGGSRMYLTGPDS